MHGRSPRDLFRSLAIAIAFTFASLAAPQAYAEGKCAYVFKDARHGPFRPQPPRLKEAANTPLAQRKRHRFASYNLENLFYSVGKWTGGHKGATKLKDAQPKSPAASKKLAETILDIDADFMAVQEVESLEALQYFVKTYLNDAYDCFLLEGNDVRGIDVGFLVRKGMPYVYEYITHKDYPGTSVGEEFLFSRDLPVLLVRDASNPKGRPLFGLATTHFKSKRDRDGDPQSNTLRGAQVAGAVNILQEFWDKTYPGLPMAMMGDYNGSVDEEKEFRPLTSVGKMKNAFHLVKPPVEGIDAVTHTYHPQGGATHPAQMDALFANEFFAPAVATAFTYRYLDERGKPKPVPDSYPERSENPSDHSPIVFDVEFQPFYALAP